MDNYSPETVRKIQLYFACNFLYEQGKSHPQVVEILSEYEKDSKLLNKIADEAGIDLWRKIFNKVQRLTASGSNYETIFHTVKSMEPDPEIIHFICQTWYRVQTAYADYKIESQTHEKEGIKGIILSTFFAGGAFYFNAASFFKILFICGIVISILLILMAQRQDKIADQLKHILTEDYTKFEKLI
ncbi:MAG: hypothetical protein R2796_09505 [Chitinophagaceae bacterium]